MAIGRAPQLRMASTSFSIGDVLQMWLTAPACRVNALIDSSSFIENAITLTCGASRLHPMEALRDENPGPSSGRCGKK